MKFYANPYNTDVAGFYFKTYAEYVEKSAELKDSFGSPVEEFEIEVIDGERKEIQLANAIKVNQCNLEEVIDCIDGDESNWPSIFYQLDCGVADSVNDAIHDADYYSIVESTLLDAATELFDDCYGSLIPDAIKNYIDYEAFARDCQCGGDMVEFEFAGSTYTCTNANQ
jgi:hypothetical protein